jgi:diguanylate cyclase (GGDEF)-like protein/PAS domain S-box-containing protein
VSAPQPPSATALTTAGASAVASVLLVCPGARLTQAAALVPGHGELAFDGVETLAGARKLLEHPAPGCVIVEVADPHDVAALREVAPAVPVIAVTADEPAGIAALRDGAQEYLVAGEVTPSTLARTVRWAIERRSVQDALQHSSAHHQAIVENLTEGVIVHGMCGAITTANPAAADILGLTLDQLCGGTPRDPRWRAVREDGSPLPGDEHPASVTLRTGQELTDVVLGVERPDGERVWLLVCSRMLSDGAEGAPYGVMVSFRNVTRRRALDKRIARLTRLYSLLAVANQAILRADSRQEVYDAACQVTVRDGGLALAWIGLLEEGGLHPVAQAGTDDGYLATLAPRLVNPVELHDHIGVALQFGVEVVAEDLSSDTLIGDGRSEALARGFRSLAVLPLHAREEILGVLAVYAAQPGFFDSEELQVLTDLAADISFALERIDANERSRAAEQRLRALVQNVSDVITVHDPDGRIRYVSPSGMALVGDGADLAAPQRMEDYLHPDDVTRARALFRALAERRGPVHPVEVRLAHQNGAWRHFECVGVNLLDDPAVRGIVVTSRDVTARREAEAALRHQALHDALTGLPNRALLLDRLERALARSRSVALLFIDLDRFKLINDSLGHSSGDEVLRAIADLLRSGLRSQDTLARIGGDEFVACCEDIPEAEIIQIVRRLEDRLRAPLGLGDRQLHISASIGIAIGDRHDTPESLLREADAAMYMAKANGRGCHAVFDADADVGWDRLALEEALRHGIEHGELEVHYQPELSLTDASVFGVEALVRWRRPSLGLISPGEFIPMAEETGLVVPLGTWVLREACRQVVRWRAEHPEWAPSTCSVNLSARQLADPGLVDLVGEVLEETGLPPETLWLEITESVLMEDTKVTAEVLSGLRDLGVHLAVDDFGTGYSSLLYLKRFPVSVLKIDRSFVDGLAREAEDTGIVTAVIDLAHSLGLQAIAEGVETPAQLQELCELGCDLAQGYLWTKPLPADELAAWLEHHHGLRRCSA